MSNEKKEQEKEILHAAIVGASTESVQRYGTAVKEHIVAYTGIDHENARQLERSLKEIAKSSINPNYAKQNYKQQAGFSAEVKEVANTNAENIINRSDIRKVRTDDLGSVNDPLFDFKELDANGNVIPGSGIQMKFVGSNPKEALNKLASKKFEKYLDNDVKLEVPSDYYDGIRDEADRTIKNIQKQIDNQKNSGNIERAEQLEKQLEKYEKIKQNLKKSSVSNEDALFARMHPELSTMKSIAQVSHRAGIETAKAGAVIGSSVSIVQNIVAVVKGEKEAEDAVFDVAGDTMTATAVGYGTGFVGSAVKGWMQNAGTESVRVLSKTNFPAVAVAVTLSVGKTMGRYFSGDINGVECLEQLGEQGTGMLSSSLFMMIGQAAIPIPIVGGMIGGMVGYAISSASYGILMSSLKEAEMAHEESIQIERECEEHIKLMKEYRAEIEDIIKKYLVSNMTLFHEAFDGIKATLDIGDVDGFISEVNSISEQLGRKPQFSDFDEFEQLMKSDLTIKI